MVNISVKQIVRPVGSFKGTGLLVIDVQERLAPAIPTAPQVVPQISALIEKARQVALPILATEQYSRGLGPTIPELRGLLASGEVLEKIHFAATREPAFRDALGDRQLKHCVVVGMEAHVCVQESVLGLLADGVAVSVVGDAVASRNDLNRRCALARMARAGASIVTSAEVLAGLEELSNGSGEALSPS